MSRFDGIDSLPIVRIGKPAIPRAKTGIPLLPDGTLEEGSIADDDVWTPISALFKERSVVSHHLDSFDRMVRSTIPDMVRNLPPQTIGDFTLTFGDLIFLPPSFTETDGAVRAPSPMECLSRNMTYSSAVHIDVALTGAEGTEIFEKVFFGSVPVMVRSSLDPTSSLSADQLISLGEDPKDPGGYFIIKGTRKVVNPQERAAGNRIYVFAGRSSPPKFDFYSEIRSSGLSRATVVQIGWIEKTRLISVLFPPLSDSFPIPLGVFFRGLLDFDISEEDILTFILGTGRDPDRLRLLVPSLEYSYECRTSATALKYLAEKYRTGMVDDAEEDEEETRSADVSRLFERDLFPHLSTPLSGMLPVKKAFFLGRMVSKLLDQLLGLRELEDRDHFANKRVTTTGALLASQFYMALRKLLRDARKTCERSATRATKAAGIIGSIKPPSLSHALASCISSNNWGRGTNTSNIAQTLEQYNFPGTLANLRKFHVPMGDSGTTMAPRRLHPSQYAISCPYETPEGKKIGIVKGAALSAGLSMGTDLEVVTSRLSELEDFNPLDFTPPTASGGAGEGVQAFSIPDGVAVLLNGDWVGTTFDPDALIATLRSDRRCGVLPAEVEMAYRSDASEVRLSIDSGRMLFPVFRVEDGKLLFDLAKKEAMERGELEWNMLLSTGVVELLGKEEADGPDILLVSFPSELASRSEEQRRLVTHCELHPSLMFGIGPSNIPFIEHNQAPRNTFQAQMGKQALGFPFTNFRQMMVGTFSYLHSPQKPLVTTRTANLLKLDEMPAGVNVVLAMIPFRGKNQEDSLVFNRASIDRGLFRSSRVFTYCLEINGELAIPSEANTTKFRGDPSKLDSDGIVAPGTRVETGDILIGYLFGPKDAAGKRVNMSVLYEEDLPAEVTRVELSVNAEGYPQVRVQITQVRIPAIGDKFSSRHGQKGTMGEMYGQEDMPFSLTTGITPDILMNPLGMPSRMTMAQLIELMYGKVLTGCSVLSEVCARDLLSGSGDGTAFRGLTVESLASELRANGIDCLAEEPMMDGMTGEVHPRWVFMGPIFYQRLRHMPRDKIHARKRGKRAALSRQPLEGRSNHGGFKIGQMEKDCIVGQGASVVAADRLHYESDPSKISVCTYCGLPALVDKTGIRSECTSCGRSRIREVAIPYGFQLLINELRACGIGVRLLLDDHDTVTGVEPRA